MNVDFDVESSGIGSYEYFGAKGFDEGQKYPVILEFTFEMGDVTDILYEYNIGYQQLRDSVDEWLESNMDKIEQKLTFDDYEGVS